MMRRHPGWALWMALLKLGGQPSRDAASAQVVKEQVLELGVLLKRLGDVTEEDAADDAAAAPHERDAGVVERPVVLLGRLAHEHEALGVGDDLGCVEGLLEVVDELLLVALERLERRATEDLGRRHALVAQGGQAAREDGLADQGDGHAEVERVDRGPLAGALLAGDVGDLGHERLAVIVVVLEDVGGDLDQERVEDTFRSAGPTESCAPLFQVLKMSAISFSSRPRPRLRMSYASQMSCMSPYSMPLWTILTYCAVSRASARDDVRVQHRPGR